MTRKDPEHPRPRRLQPLELFWTTLFALWFGLVERRADAPRDSAPTEPADEPTPDRQAEPKEQDEPARDATRSLPALGELYGRQTGAAAPTAESRFAAAPWLVGALTAVAVVGLAMLVWSLLGTRHPDYLLLATTADNGRLEAVVVAGHDPRAGRLGLLVVPAETLVRVPEQAAPARLAEVLAAHGPAALTLALSDLLRVEITDHLILGPPGVVALVDGLGGLALDGDLAGLAPPDARRLTGADAALLLARTDDGADPGYLERVRVLADAALAQVRTGPHLSHSPSLWLGLLPYAQSNLTADAALALGRRAAPAATAEQMAVLLPGRFFLAETGWHYYIDPEAARVAVLRVLGDNR